VKQVAFCQVLVKLRINLALPIKIGLDGIFLIYISHILSLTN